MIKTFLYCAVFAICGASLLAADTPAAEKQTIFSIDEQYVKAFNSKDVEAVAKFYTDDAVYLTDYGKTLRGKEEIKRAFAEQFREMGDATLKLNVYGIEFTPDLKKATERGVSIVESEGVSEPSSYVAEYSKQGNQWLLSRVTESAQAASAEHLRPLEWMVGDWTDQAEDAAVRTRTEWALDRAFITRRFDVSGEGRRSLKGIEYIGWDPIKKEIHSWYFDSEGGYGGGRWRRDGNRWVEEATGITPSGETALATQIFTPKDKDSFTWRSVNRRVGGEAQDDMPEITIQRSKGEQASAAARGQL
jgi:uncharacterized protein (TIGR02246 family)